MEVEEGTSATVTELILAVVDEEELNLPRQTTITSNPVSNSDMNGGTGNRIGGNIIAVGEIFTLWMTSPLLDVQLKPHHKVRKHFTFRQDNNQCLLPLHVTILPLLIFDSHIVRLWIQDNILIKSLLNHYYLFYKMIQIINFQPFYIRREWNHFLQRFSSAPLERKSLDEPILSLQRNVFFHKRDEVKLR